MNYTLIQLLLQFQMLAHLGLGILIVAPLSEHPDSLHHKISATCKAAMKLHQSQLHKRLKYVRAHMVS